METKICTRCHQELPLDSFNRGNGRLGRRSICRECEHIIQNDPIRVARRRELERIRRADPEYVKLRNEKDRLRVHSNETSIRLALLRNAKQRARVKNLEFNIDISDIVLPSRCPLLGISMEVNDKKAKANSYTVDRIDPTKGYVKGNVWVISKRANVIKSDATLEELELLVANLKLKFERT